MSVVRETKKRQILTREKTENDREIERQRDRERKREREKPRESKACKSVSLSLVI